MKCVLYAVRIRQRWVWRFSLHPETDWQYWQGLLPNELQVLKADPALSLGQAVWLRDRLQKAECSGRTDIGAMEKQLASLTPAMPGMKPSDTRRWRVVQQDVQPWNGEQIGKLLPAAYRMAEGLDGRSLLQEEWTQWLEASGHGASLDKQGQLRMLQLAYLQGWVELTTGMSQEDAGRQRTKDRKHRCRRCGSGDAQGFRSFCLFCGGDCAYCEQCLTMGRSRTCSLLIRGKLWQTLRHEERGGRSGEAAGQRKTGRDGAADSGAKLLTRKEDGGASDRDESEWKRPKVELGKWALSPAQTEAVGEALAFLDGQAPPTRQKASGWWKRAVSLVLGNRRGEVGGQPPRFLLWAVTGAGKTEMIFPLIERELLLGGRAVIATPRRDVVLELLPRLRKAFPDRTVIALYGGSEQKWERGDITLATTHQLMRFHEGFGLVIIDELDAFPYHNNPMLQYAAQQVVRPGGKYVFLSATPPAPLQKEARAGRLPHVRVPVRFHRYPLPVPRCMQVKPVDDLLKRGTVPACLRDELRVSLDRGAQIFLFVPKIKAVAPMVRLLRSLHPDLSIDGTSSQDEQRAEKVIAFREGRIRFLVTTTILERGVTVPKTDVFIVGADSALFDEAALVQMAGRAGRAKDDPKGRVLFAAPSRNRSQTGAIRQIKRMNRIAGQKGYLIKEGETSR